MTSCALGEAEARLLGAQLFLGEAQFDQLGAFVRSNTAAGDDDADEMASVEDDASADGSLDLGAVGDAGDDDEGWAWDGAPFSGAWDPSAAPGLGCPPPPPYCVAPTRAPTVHSLPPYCCPYPCPYCILTHSLLLPLPVSLLYTHSLPP